jgi:hypothetical protein
MSPNINIFGTNVPRSIRELDTPAHTDVAIRIRSHHDSLASGAAPDCLKSTSVSRSGWEEMSLPYNHDGEGGPGMSLIQLLRVWNRKGSARASSPSNTAGVLKESIETPTIGMVQYM